MRELLDGLDALRVRAARGTGKPKVSLRHLETMTGVPRSSLSGYLSGATPLPVDVLDAIVLALGANQTETRAWANAWERVMLPSARPMQNQLPAAVHDLIGREEQLSELDKIRTSSALITGTAGVGKTALAIRWAHSAATRFPDGQLYVNLRGFDPGAQASSPADVLRGFLEVLGVSPQLMPSTLDARTGLYRSLLAGKRVLVVLDNARDAEQVRPLLPGAKGCLAVVTSRRQLTSLIVTEGTHPMVLDVLSAGAAHELLASRLDHDRIAADPLAAQEIVERCARLPLALAIVAARAAVRPQLSLRDVSSQLRASLAPFTDTDPSVDLRAVFAQSYRDLTKDAARLFRLLGAHPGQDFSISAAASLAGVPMATAYDLVAELLHTNMLSEPSLGRYTFHDLLRAYALELTDADRDEAHRRLVDHYLHSAHRASGILSPQRGAIDLHPPGMGVVMEPLSTRAEVIAWMAGERQAALAIVDYAVRAGMHAQVWQLAWALADYLQQQGHWLAQLSLQTAAWQAAQHLGEVQAQARSLNSLARACTWLDRADDAIAHFHRALELYRELGDLAGQAHTHLGLNWVNGRQPDCQPQTLLFHSQQALELFRELGDTVGEARALNCVGWAHAKQGEYGQTLVACGKAQEILAQAGYTEGEAHAWDSVGFAHFHLHDHHQAVTCYQRAIELFQSVGQRSGEADSLDRLGDALMAAQDLPGARQAWQRALSTLDEFGDPKADGIRAKLQG